MNTNELKFALQLHTVRRWQIVETTRDQSVAEHAYRVWLLVEDLYEKLFAAEYTSTERESIGRLALLHDIDEIVTGDIPATIKQSISNEVLEHTLDHNFPTIAAQMRGMRKTFGYYIVKIADNVEAILYMQAYGVTRPGLPGDKDTVIRTRVEALGEIWNHVRRAHPGVQWDIAVKWVGDLVGWD